MRSRPGGPLKGRFREESRLLFEDCAPVYPQMDPFWGGPEEILDALDRVLVGDSLSGEDVTILDVGCGPGIHLLATVRYLARLIPPPASIEARGIDFSEHMIGQATDLVSACSLPARFRLSVSDILDWCPSGSDRFDVVLCINNTLGNLVGDDPRDAQPQRVRALKAIADALKPSGTLMLSVYSLDELSDKGFSEGLYTEDRSVDLKLSDVEAGDLVLWRACTDGTRHACLSHWFTERSLRSELLAAGLGCVLVYRAGPRIVCAARAEHGGAR